MRQGFGLVIFVSRYALLIAMVAIGLIFSPTVHATATLRISADDGLTWTNVVDNGPLDVNTNVGAILYNGSGSAFSGVFVATSQYGSDVPSYLDLNCSLFSAPTALVFQYSDTGFGPFKGSFASSIGGNGSTMVACKTLMDPTGQLFAGTALASATGLTGDFAWSSNSPIFSLTSYSLTSEVRLSAPASGTRFDLLMTANAPLPPTILPPTISNGDVNVSFETESGFTYVLESNSSVIGGEWTALQSIDGNGSVVTLVDPVSSSHTKFYRVIVH